MDLTIIGTGNMTRGIATRALAGGNAVTLLGTERGKADALAGELPGDVRTGTVGDPLATDVVVLSVLYPAFDDIVSSLPPDEIGSRYGQKLTGRISVVIATALRAQTYQLIDVEAGSTAQELA